jgi:hypothetical protein
VAPGWSAGGDHQVPLQFSTPFTIGHFFFAAGGDCFDAAAGGLGGCFAVAAGGLGGLTRGGGGLGGCARGGVFAIAAAGGLRDRAAWAPAALNPAGDRKVERFGWTFAPGDKVMQIENDYDNEVYNGDMGYIDDLDPNAGEIVASFDGLVRHLRIGRTRHAGAGYAATIHKSKVRNIPPRSSRS